MSNSGIGGPVLSSNALPIGTRVHEFEVTRVIGEGGFSVVYLAFDHTLHRSIALKEYIPSALAGRRGDNTVAVRSAQHQQTFEAGLRSFINEARLLAQFDHPALVKVYRFWEANGTAYMAMPYYQGRTLKQILREHPEQATEAWLKQLLAPILDALELLHGHRCYHRDIAPDNIQVLDSQVPVLLDFGAARRTIGDMTQAFTVILKPGYAPIEQYADETDLKQGPWTDVYALAAVLYAAVVQKPPPTAVARVIKDPLEPLTKRALPGYSRKFLAGIDRGLGVRPEARPQSIAEMRELLGVPAHVHHHADVGPRIAAAAGSATEMDDAYVPDAAAKSAIARAGSPASDAAVTMLGSVEPGAEKDRTVLVPGLRRATAEPPPDDAAPNARPGDSPGYRVEMPKPALFKRLIVLVAIGAVLAVVVALVAFRDREQTITTAKQAVVAEPAPGRIDVQPKPTAAPDGAAAPASASHALPLPKPAPSDVSKEPASGKAPPRTNATPESPPAGTASVASPAVTTSESQSTMTAVPPHATDRPSEPPGPPVAASPEPAAQAEPAASPARPPVVSADERRWAAIKGSNKIADFLAFQLKYPNSPRSSDAAARISELERLRPPSELPAANQGKAPSATGDDRTRLTPAEPSARIPAAGGGAKAVVRVRVRPFGYVYVDGTLVGASPPVQSIEVGPGKHRIEARNPEARPPIVSTEIDVTGTQPRDVQLRFSE
ncbi:MAG TPA: protein kinase [Burkholderiales bacterium]|nr:protein kinase [Burkholderiales bacterium]